MPNARSMLALSVASLLWAAPVSAQSITVGGQIIFEDRRVPLKFSLDGGQGRDIFHAGFPASQPIACDSFAVLGAFEETTSAGQSGLTYDPFVDQYTYVWKTEKAWADTCRQLVFTMTDGSFHVANFKF